ncbi:protein transporter tim9 [Nowakowskiella sp. JEL0407]|nr:protein transporter tim9 [Nowakowskiella sp. JEL0407]
MDFSRISQADQNKFQQLIEEYQVRDFMRLYSGLVDRCFTDCVNDFTSKALSTKELNCVQKCSEKFFRHSERVGMRFAEQNALLSVQQQESGNPFGAAPPAK